ncbi:unnamed protein product [Caretta caretta]
MCCCSELEQRLANAKKKASQMEKLLPKQITSEDQREVLRLLCKAHKLEVGNTELQANALYKENLLCQKDFVIQQQHGLFCEEIIQQQQMLFKGHDIPVPEMLGMLYQLHCRELEEGTLTHLLLLHSVLSSTLRGGCALNIARQLDLNKEARKGLSGNRKGLPCGAKFELPSIVLESDSDSYRSSKTTPTRKLGNPDTHLSPTFFCLPRTPLHQLWKAKHRTPSSHNMDNVSEDQLPRAKLFQALKIMSNLSHATPAATKVKFPINHHTGYQEENPLQVLEIGNTPPSTVQQSNAGQTRGQVLQKRVKGPVDGASNQPKKQPITSFRNLPRSK